MNLEQSPHRIFESAESDLLPMLMPSAFRQALETSIDLNASSSEKDAAAALPRDEAACGSSVFTASVVSTDIVNLRT